MIWEQFVHHVEAAGVTAAMQIDMIEVYGTLAAVAANALCALWLYHEAMRYRRMARDLQEYLWTEHGMYWEEDHRV